MRYHGTEVLSAFIVTIVGGTAKFALVMADGIVDMLTDPFLKK